tara:strand:- start:68 stop:679 length:612 start_codon:yes stop_codon:yes gene_type:complete
MVKGGIAGRIAECKGRRMAQYTEPSGRGAYVAFPAGAGAGAAGKACRPSERERQKHIRSALNVYFESVRGMEEAFSYMSQASNTREMRALQTLCGFSRSYAFYNHEQHMQMGACCIEAVLSGASSRQVQGADAAEGAPQKGRAAYCAACSAAIGGLDLGDDGMAEQWRKRNLLHAIGGVHQVLPGSVVRHVLGEDARGRAPSV